MKKPSIIIGKKQIILTCMTLMLGAAVYLNYALSNGKNTVEKNISVSKTMSHEDQSSNKEEKAESYGESEFVNASADDYFAQARLERTANRDEAVQTLQTIMGGGDASEEELKTGAVNAVQVSRLIESEGNIESLIKAQGIEDCVVYLDGKSAKVVVKSSGLEKSKAAAIKDIILSEADVPAENIRIFEVK